MKNIYWKLVEGEGSSGLTNLLKNEINFQNPRPKPQDLVGVLDNNTNKFLIWIKGEGSIEKKSEINPRYKWVSRTIQPSKFSEELEKDRENIVPLSINLPKHESPVIWYLLRQKL